MRIRSGHRSVLLSSRGQRPTSSRQRGGRIRNLLATDDNRPGGVVPSSYWTLKADIFTWSQLLADAPRRRSVRLLAVAAPVIATAHPLARPGDATWRLTLFSFEGIYTNIDGTLEAYENDEAMHA